MDPDFCLLDGHSGVVLPGPIPNPEVKRANVSGSTVLLNGSPDKLSIFLHSAKLSSESTNSSYTLPKTTIALGKSLRFKD